MPPQNPEQARWFATELEPHGAAVRAYLLGKFPTLPDVDDVVQEGDEVVVKCISVDRDGKIRLSRKDALDANPDEIQHFVA